MVSCSMTTSYMYFFMLFTIHIAIINCFFYLLGPARRTIHIDVVGIASDSS